MVVDTNNVVCDTSGDGTTPKRSLDQWHESMVKLQIAIDDLQCELAATLDEEVAHAIRNRLQLLYAEREALFTTTEDWLEHYR